MKYLEVVAEQIVLEYNSKFNTDHAIQYIEDEECSVKYIIESNHLHLTAHVSVPLRNEDFIMSYSDVCSLIDSALSVIDGKHDKRTVVDSCCINIPSMLKLLEEAYQRS